MSGLAAVTSESGGPQSPSSAFLRVALVGPLDETADGLATHTVAVADQLSQAGHEVTLVSWSASADAPRSPAPSFRTVRSLAWNRPDTWLRTGRRLRAYDAVVLVHTGAVMVPLQLALLAGAGIRRRSSGAADGGPRGVLLCDTVLPVHPRAATRGLVASLLGRVDGVLVHRAEEVPLAARLGAARVYGVEPPERLPAARRQLTARWAAYVGAIEALAAPEVAAIEVDADADVRLTRASPSWETLARRAARRAVDARSAASRLADSLAPTVDLRPADLPEWVRPTDVLDDAWQADEARAEVRRLGLPRCRDGIAAWAALGSLAAVVRLTDGAAGEGGNDRRAALLVDESGSGSPFGRWARLCGFAPVALGLTASGDEYDPPDLDPETLDVVVRVHPGGCDSSDLDDVLSQVAWALRPGGLLVVTLPLGRPGTEGALAPADVRAAVARAHATGLALVGDLDGDVGRRMRAAGLAAEGRPARMPGAAYGLVRLTFRRR